LTGAYDHFADWLWVSYSGLAQSSAARSARQALSGQTGP